MRTPRLHFDNVSPLIKSEIQSQPSLNEKNIAVTRTSLITTATFYDVGNIKTYSIEYKSSHN